MEPSREWATAIDRWIAHQRAAGRPPTTLSTRRYHLERVARCSPARTPADVDGEELLGWFAAQAWAQDTRRSYRQSIIGFFEWAGRAGVAQLDARALLPIVRASRPRPHPTPERAYRAALLAASPRERLMVRLAAEVGLRRAEVAAVHSRDLVNDLAGWSLIVHGKGGRERVVPLPRSLGAELRLRPAGYVFPGDDGGHLSPRWVGKLVGRLLPDGSTMHSLRHRFATLAYSIDRDVFTVQELLGHASSETTRRYVLVPNDALRRTVDALAA